jgi:dolichol-phosphate mannosyltransferase
VNDLSDLQSQFIKARQPRLSVVLPLRNAAEEVEERIAEVAVEAEYSHLNLAEIIVVDDASDDLTWATLQSLAWREPLLRPIRLRKPFGLEAARETGALAATGDIVITLEPDAPASDIGQFEGLIEADFDVVTGWRRGRRNGLSLMGRAAGLRQHEPLSASAAYRREVLGTLTQAGTALAHVPFAAGPAGFRVGEMELAAPRTRRAARGMKGVTSVLGAAGGLFATERMLGSAILFGFLLLVAAVAVPVVVLLLSALLGWGVSPGLMALIGVGLLVAGLQLAGTGFVGSMILSRTPCRNRAGSRIAEQLLRHGTPD